MNKTLHTTITVSFTLLILAPSLFSVIGCDLFAPKYDYNFINESSYTLTIKNMTSSAVIDFVRWNGVYFGKNTVWDAVLGQYVYGMIPGGSDIKEVSPGYNYVYFWFAAGGSEYRTAALLPVRGMR